MIPWSKIIFKHSSQKNYVDSKPLLKPWSPGNFNHLCIYISYMIAKLGPGKILNYLEVDEILMNLCFVKNADRKAIRQGKVGIAHSYVKTKRTSRLSERAMSDTCIEFIPGPLVAFSATYTRPPIFVSKCEHGTIHAFAGCAEKKNIKLQTIRIQSSSTCFHTIRSAFIMFF